MRLPPRGSQQLHEPRRLLERRPLQKFDAAHVVGHQFFEESGSLEALFQQDAIAEKEGVLIDIESHGPSRLQDHTQSGMEFVERRGDLRVARQVQQEVFPGGLQQTQQRARTLSQSGLRTRMPKRPGHRGIGGRSHAGRCRFLSQSSTIRRAAWRTVLRP